ncbi:hypothetical protein G3N57_35000, partial [Paraburkholderia sp. Se-20369]|nr:hypothetical protein [Paraburkholderia sp. Se-20369]
MPASLAVSPPPLHSQPLRHLPADDARVAALLDRIAPELATLPFRLARSRPPSKIGSVTAGPRFAAVLLA